MKKINTLNCFWEEHLQEINTLISKIYYLKKSAMDYLNIDLDEYRSLANEIIASNFEDFFEDYESDREDSIMGLIYRVLQRKTDTYIRDQNRDKRKANLRTVSLSAPNPSTNEQGEDMDLTLENVLVGDKGIKDENLDSGIYKYLKILSDKQKSIVILKLLDFTDSDIISSMNISRKEFNSLLNSMRMIEKKQLIYRN